MMDDDLEEGSDVCRALNQLLDAVVRDVSLDELDDALAVILNQTLSPSARRCAARLLYMSHGVASAAHRLKVVPELLHMHLDETDPRFVIRIIDTLSRDPNTYVELLALGPLKKTMPLLTCSLLDDPTLSARALAILPRLVDTTDAARYFWNQGGTFLIHAVARHRCADAVTTTTLLQSLGELVMRDSDETERHVSRVCSQALVDALVKDVRAFDQVYEILDMVLVSSTLRKFLSPHEAFVRATTDRLANAACDMSVESLDTALAHLCDMLFRRGRRTIREEDFRSTDTSVLTVAELFDIVEDRLFETSSPDAGAGVALCLDAPTSEVAMRWPQLLAVLERCPPAAREVLDDAMHTHWKRLEEDAMLACRPLRVLGRPPDVLSHMSDVLVGSRVPDPTTRVGASMIKRLTPLNQLRRVKIECPIAHEGMTCPMVMSDGHTYDLTMAVRITRHGLSSPLTRELLEPWAVYNRALVVHHDDEGVTKSVELPRCQDQTND